MTELSRIKVAQSIARSAREIVHLIKEDEESFLILFEARCAQKMLERLIYDLEEEEVPGD